MKREPTLADRLISEPVADSVFSREDRRLRQRIAAAKKYVLDEAATRWLANLVKTLPDAVVEAGEFAIPPHPLMWVEYDARVMHEICRVPDQPDFLPAEDADTMVGYLYDGPNVFPGCAGPSPRTGRRIVSSMAGTVYKLNQPFTWGGAREAANLWGVSPVGLDMILWGSSYVDIDERNARALREQHSLSLMKSDVPLDEDRGRRIAQRIMSSGAGELRKILYILLVLNRTAQTIRMTEVGNGRAMIGNRPSTLTRHHRITFVLNPEPEIRRIMEGPIGQAWRRRHDVRGHFCHDRTAREASYHGTCSHDWMETGARKDRQWGCARCGGKRWWREAHQRGHIEKGFVESIYEVTAQ